MSGTRGYERIDDIIDTFWIYLGFLFPPKQVCYGKYGCFKRQSGLDALLVKLPESPSAVGTTFQMFTRVGSGIVNDVDGGKVRAAKFDISLRTIFIIHGYHGKCLFVYSAEYFELYHKHKNRMKQTQIRDAFCNNRLEMKMAEKREEYFWVKQEDL